MSRSIDSGDGAGARASCSASHFSVASSNFLMATMSVALPTSSQPYWPLVAGCE